LVTGEAVGAYSNPMSVLPILYSDCVAKYSRKPLDKHRPLVVVKKKKKTFESSSSSVEISSVSVDSDGPPLPINQSIHVVCWSKGDAIQAGGNGHGRESGGREHTLLHDGDVLLGGDHLEKENRQYRGGDGREGAIQLTLSVLRLAGRRGLSSRSEVNLENFFALSGVGGRPTLVPFRLSEELVIRSA
jgi:hypothetical protein